MWVATGSAYCAEICAGADLDWLLIDSEHVPNDVRSLLAHLQAVAPYGVTPVIRPPTGDPVIIKQLLDIGAEVLLIPMVDSAEQARELVRAVRYPPDGVRGVGSALARASRWNRVPGYLQNATESVSLMVQVESQAGLDALPEIVAVEGIDAIFLGPSDLAASLGQLGRQDHPDVVAAVEAAIRTIVASGKAAGVNAFAENLAARYLAAGAKFLLVGADVALLAQGSDALARRHRNAD
jgi:4-hydroxy-2-oxoheptanedioate aldolase